MPFGACASVVVRSRSLPWLFFLVCASASGISLAQTDLAGYVSIEPRIFLDPPTFSGQTDDGLSPSAVVAPEYRHEWNHSNDRLTVIPFLRLDADDDERAHFDIREASWQHLAGPWTYRLGIGRVFWGVTESRHLVDIVNQTDQVEDIDQEDKLGQPMINVERFSDFGTFSMFLLPGFRERIFPADDGRLRGPLPIDTHRAVYESGRKNRRTDIALRWEQTLNDWDIGVSGFHGNGREPKLVPQEVTTGRQILVPHYDVVSQLGLDIQYTRGPWLVKLEAIRRSGQGRAFAAFTTGFEYTLYALRNTNKDLGLLIERLYDGRDARAPVTALADDIFLGTRLALNDVNDTMLLIGAIVDRDDHGVASFVEGRRRVWERWRLELELRLLDNVESEELRGFKNDSFLTVRMARFF